MPFQYVLLIDLDRCTGCSACVIACKQEHHLPPRLDALPGTSGFSFIRIKCVGPEGTYPELSMYYLPLMCMHCAKPECIGACAAEAIIRRDDGVIVIDGKACTGCETCISKCPYGAIQLDRESETAKKCNLCDHLISQKSQPACVKACTMKAITFRNMEKFSTERLQQMKRVKGNMFVLDPESGTEPSVKYIKRNINTL